MRAVLIGNTPGNSWSNPAVWANGTVPASSSNLNIQLDVGSTDDLGTALNPLVIGNVIGASSGMVHPSLAMRGFLHADNIRNLDGIEISEPAGITVRHDVVNVSRVDAHDGGFLSVGHDLKNVQDVSISFGSTVGVGHGIDNTAFSFGIGGGNLILDHPAAHGLHNLFAVGDGVAPATIELGHIAFNSAEFIPNSPGSLTGRLDLLENGCVAYQLSDVKEFAAGGTFAVGVDSKTGYDYVSYQR